jgi:heme/copper-type cytochrome/quinol oxidase subunit 2
MWELELFWLAIGIVIVATILLFMPRGYLEIRDYPKWSVSPSQIKQFKNDFQVCNWCWELNWVRDFYCRECGHKLGVNKW